MRWNMVFLLALSLFLTTNISTVNAVGKVTVDPNIHTDSQTTDLDDSGIDARLRQEITYEARHKSVRLILDDLSSMTGIKLYSGSNSKDWQVRDRKMCIFAKKVLLGNLMTSIARTMKFRWNKSDDKFPSYRLYMNRKVLLEAEGQRYREEEQYNKQRQKKREAAVNWISEQPQISPAELAEMRDKDPWKYILASGGISQHLGKFLHEVPDVASSLASGESSTISIKSLSPTARAALLEAIHAAWKFNDRMHLGASPPGLKGKLSLPENMDDATITINANADDSTDDISSRALLSEIKFNYFNKYTEVKDGHNYDYGCNDSVQIPIYDSESGFARDIGKMSVEAIESDNNPFDQSWSVSVDPSEMRNMDFGEAVVKHPDDPELEMLVDLKPAQTKEKDKQPDVKDKQPDIYEDTLAAIAESTGYALVADSYSDYPVVCIPSKETLNKTINMISMLYDCNWWKRGHIIELRNRYWYKKRSLQIPDEVLDGYRTRFNTNKILDIEDMSQIAALITNQFNFNIKGDEILDQFWITNTYRTQTDILRIYNALDSTSRKMLFTDGGVVLRALPQDRLNKVFTIIRKNLPDISDEESDKLSLVCKKTALQNNKGFQYEFHLLDADVKENFKSRWLFQTPQYIEPKNTAKQ